MQGCGLTLLLSCIPFLTVAVLRAWGVPPVLALLSALAECAGVLVVVRQWDYHHWQYRFVLILQIGLVLGISSAFLVTLLKELL